MRIEAGELAHRPHRRLAQHAQPVAVLFVMIDLLIGPKRLLDLLVGRQLARLRQAGLACSLALGERIVLDAILGHQPRSQVGNAAAAIVAAVILGHVMLRALRTAGCAPLPAAPPPAPPPAGGWRSAGRGARADK